MTSPSANLWTPEEDAILLANIYLQQGELSALIPGRSPGSCSSRRLKLRRDIEPTQPVRSPPPAPIKICQEDYAGMSLTARLMGDPIPSRSGLFQKLQGGTP